MKVHAKLVLPSAALLACVLATSPAWSQSSDPAWVDDLRMQLQVEKQCEVNYFINMREGQLGVHATFEARVQCVDGRMFDAARTEPEKTFTITACGAELC
ncbi:MAG: hypothetical protein MnENMB40S_15260 [Rhizobiaceae bacterium MnEN-MB40S]|nr:MAG: hypothetical protein MnENMB40S_15260 [Rhizobiaceae bacterium MnEN-MB40S]